MANSFEKETSLITLPRIQSLEGIFFDNLMASSDVDQRSLGRFAKATNDDNPFLASMLYKILGLSVLLAKKLVRARRLRRLDTTRDTKSLQLYHHIIWMSREGLVILEQYILPMVADYVELKVLAYKLRASFYHIFVLFHNQPSINQAAIPSHNGASNKGKSVDRNSSIRKTPPFADMVDGRPMKNAGSLPPGLAPVSIPKPSASFLLPAVDYIPTASSCFTTAAALSDNLLSGSHPIRLSVKVEYAAYLYDCLHDGEGSRKLAQQAIRDVYNAQEGMDDETFEDAAELVGILGKMMKRGLNGTPSTLGQGSLGTPGIGSSVGTPSTPRPKQNGTTQPYDSMGIPPAVPSPGMQNPI
ncbi:hypothetical protein MMC09_003525 [Bachmanniomyces sp. S44760]|nr:hypothetical protein [Bachmanniomyces sp. S44760]